MTVRALIFDVDGTLAETEELHRRAFNETFAAWRLGWHWDRETYGRLLRTTGGKERIRRYMEEIGADPASLDIARLHAEKTARFGELVAAGELAPRPGIPELIEEARVAGLRLAVATTTSRPNVDALSMALFGRPADEVFHVIAAGDEVPAKKPAPDVYRLALSRLGLPARDCVAFEDSRNGLLSALAAGIRCIVAPSTYTRGQNFAGACCVLEEFTDLGGLAALAGTPDAPALC